MVAIGSVGIAMMSTADKTKKELFSDSGEATYERVVELPLWNEYGEVLKSEIADLKNIGGKSAGSITAELGPMTMDYACSFLLFNIFFLVF